MSTTKEILKAFSALKRENVAKELELLDQALKSIKDFKGQDFKMEKLILELANYRLNNISKANELREKIIDSI